MKNKNFKNKFKIFQVEELRKEIARYKNVINALESELFTIKENYDNMNRELEDLGATKSYFKSEVEKLTIELAHKNRELLEKY